MAPAPAKPPEKKVASASPPPPGLDLPGLPLSPPPPPAKPPEKKETVAIATPPKPIKTENKPLAAATPPRVEPKRVPTEATTDTPLRGQPQAESGGATRIVAYGAAVVAVVALGGGALAFTKASSAHSDLTSNVVKSAATNQSLLDTEAKNKTLSFVGFAGGLVAAGIATALFVF